ncbi:MAG: hypothetical protein AB8F78_08425 [Saprospiraceae bacterium]
MEALSPDYLQRLEDIKSAIQESELLSTYIDSEEQDDYAAFKEAFESEIAALYQEVANVAPLQIESLELALLDEGLEGLYLPRVLGYAVLRPRVDSRGFYYRPQEHLKKVMLAIAQSAAFPELERRIGQGVTVALALSTNVWVSSLLEDVPNKIPRNFYVNNHNSSIRTAEQRLQVHARYARQFAKENYATASMPTSVEEATVSFPDVLKFLEYRFGHDVDNSSLAEPLFDLLKNTDLQTVPGYKSVLTLTGMFQEMPESNENKLRDLLREAAGDSSFSDPYFSFLASLHQGSSVEVTAAVDRRMAQRIGTSGDGLVQQYYALVEKVHANGINHLETQDAIRVFIGDQKGLSDVVECVRQTVLRYFTEMLGNLDTDHYTEFFEASKLFAVHFDIFDNESFKQAIRTLSTRYVKSCLKIYTDKRGRDYQDIKKFVKRTWVDLGFMTEREVTNFFKTKRTRTPASA